MELEKGNLLKGIERLRTVAALLHGEETAVFSSNEYNQIASALGEQMYHEPVVA